jgi:hypothetical protein
MNHLPTELRNATRDHKLLILWGAVPIDLAEREPANRALVINRWLEQAQALPMIDTPFFRLPPVPILSLESTARIEEHFQRSGRILRVVSSARAVPAQHEYTLIKLAGDLTSRAGVVLSREALRSLHSEADKRYLLDQAQRISAQGAVLLLGCEPGRADFKAWWSILAPLFNNAKCFAIGDPALDWPARVTCLGPDAQSIFDELDRSIAVPGMAEAMPPSPMSPLIDLSGRTNLHTEELLVRRDFVQGGQSTEAPSLEVQTLRIDAAVPEQVVVGRVFDLAVAIKQMASPLLAVKDLTHVESGEVQTTWESNTPLINLRLEVDAPDCEIEGKRSILFRLVRGSDSPLFYFRLKPLQAGQLSIVVTIYQEDYWLGSARVNTLAADQATAPIGQVKIAVSSQQLLWLDCELRLYARQAADYPIELTLNGEQVMSGRLSADLLPFAPTGDPITDGQRLFDALFADPDLREAWGEARGRSKQRRLRLRIDPLELRGLPWELLRDDADSLAADAATPFSRYLATDQAWGGPIEARPIRVLAVISNPIDLQAKYNLPPADVELETRLLKAAFAKIGASAVQLNFLAAPVTLERLAAELQTGYHILHFIGHGAFNSKQQQAALYVQNADQTAQRASGDDLAGLLKRLASPPHLIVLAACQSAVQSQRESFGGLGPQLVQIGVPAVIAMQDNVTVLTARGFGAKFYRRLLEHGTVDLAMNEARSTLIITGRYDAAVPVLFMRLRDGRLWGERLQVAAPIKPVTFPTIENPFYTNGRINDPSMFFDREQLVREIREELKKRSSVSLSGDSQMGKSSLLNYLYATRAEWLPDVPIEYIDLQRVLDETDFCETVLQRLGLTGNSLRELKHALETHAVILLLDEVERIAEPDFSTRLHDLLRSLAQDSHFAMCVATQHPLEEVFPSRSTNGVSPFHNIFTRKTLGPFTESIARRFLTTQLARTGVNFTERETEKLLRDSQCQPARLQLLAKNLFDEKIHA